MSTENPYSSGVLAHAALAPVVLTNPHTSAAARRLLLDSIGCALAATATPGGRALIAAASHAAGARAPDGGALATAPAGLRHLGTLNPLDSAQLGAQLTNNLDYDDTLYGHPGAVVVPTVLALGRAGRISGSDALAAVITGYELAGRIGAASAPSAVHRARIWGTGCRYAPAVAGVAARLLGLNCDQTAHAIAIAASTGPLPAVAATVYGTLGPSMSKNGYGAAVAAGITAAYQAAHGVTGPLDIFDAPDGFPLMIGTDRWDTGELDGAPDPQVHLVATKPYPCCRKIHSSIDGALAIQRRHQVAPEVIDRITASAPAWQDHLCFADPDPRTVPAAQFSAPYCISAALCGYAPGLSWFAAETWTDPLVRRLAGRTQLRDGDPDLPADQPWCSRVHVETANGRWTIDVPHPWGDPERPMNTAVLTGKFRQLAEPVLGRRQTAQVLTTIAHVNQLTDLRDLTGLLAPDTAAAPDPPDPTRATTTQGNT
jgi:2-methylcitrate dehydratase PrpD